MNWPFREYLLQIAGSTFKVNGLVSSPEGQQPSACSNTQDPANPEPAGVDVSIDQVEPTLAASASLRDNYDVAGLTAAEVGNHGRPQATDVSTPNAFFIGDSTSAAGGEVNMTVAARVKKLQRATKIRNAFIVRSMWYSIELTR